MFKSFKVSSKYFYFFIAVLGIIFFVEACYLLVLPKIFNKFFDKSKITNELIKEDIKLELDDLKLKTYADFSAEISAKKLFVSDLEKVNTLEVKNAALKVFLPSLLFKKVSFKRISADDLRLSLVRNADGDFYFGKIKLNSSGKVDFELDNAVLNLNAYKINFEDRLLGQKVALNGDYLRVFKFVPGKDIDFSVNGVLTSGKVSSAFDITMSTKLPFLKNSDDKNFFLGGYINGLKPKMFLKYLQAAGLKDVLDVPGDITMIFNTRENPAGGKTLMLSLMADNLALMKKSRIESIVTHGKTTVDAKINLDDKSVKVADFVLKGSDYKVTMDALIKNIKSKTPDYLINIKIPYGRTESVVMLIPSDLPDDGMIKKIKKYGLYSDAKGVLKIYGKFNTSNDHHVFGTINAKNAYVVDKYNDYKNTTIDVSFDDDTLYVSSMVIAKDKEWVDVKGMVKIFDPKQYAEFKIKSSKSVELSNVQKILMPIHDTFQFELGPLPIMTVSAGRGNIDLFAKGNSDTGEAYGEFNFSRAAATFDDLNTKLYNSDGQLAFLGKTFTFKTKTGHIEGSKAFVNGTADIDGNIDFDVGVDNTSLETLIYILNTSPMLKEQKEFVSLIKKANGKTDFRLKLKGRVTDLYAFDIAKNLTPSGSLFLKSAEVIVEPFSAPLSGLTGNIWFKNEDVDFDLNGKMFASFVNVLGSIKSGKAEIKASAPAMNLSDAVKFSGLENSKNLTEKTSAVMDMKLAYRTDALDKPINYDAVRLDVKFKPQNVSKNKPVAVSSGNFLLNNGNAEAKNINIKLYNQNSGSNTVFVNGKVNKLFDKKPVSNFTVKAHDFDLNFLNGLSAYSFVPQEVREFAALNKHYKGNASLNITTSNNKPKGTVTVRDTGFINTASQIPVSIQSADFVLDDNKLKIDSFNASMDDMPLFANVYLTNIYANPRLNGHFTTKLNDKFVDKYINAHVTYPLKLKGEVVLSGALSGALNNLSVKPVLKLEKESDIFYMGSNLGDEGDLRDIRADITLKKDSVSIHQLQYRKFVTLQTGDIYPLPLLQVKGIVNKFKDGFYVKSMNIKTKNTASARLFNMIFRKSILKEGTFNCDLNIAGDAKHSKMTGSITLKNLDMPIYSTTINDIILNLDKDFAYVDLRAKAYDSDIVVNAKLENRLETPIRVIDLNLYSKKIDLDKMLDTIGDISLNSYNTSKLPQSTAKPAVEIKDIEILKAKITADDVVIKGLGAKNYKTDVTLKNSLLSFDNISFNIAQGQVLGGIKYNFINDEIAMAMAAKDVDANLIASSIFNAQGQIYGKMNGELRMMTKGASEDERMKNLTGLAYFEINDGKMPKLGSLEYLLKAGNLVKSGITGFTMNGLVDLVVPIKTGYFSTIKGNLIVEKGVAKNIHIYSKGEKLSIYVNGMYNLITENADMNVIGSLSKKVSTVLGPVGNASLNTLFNLIPGLNLDEAEKAKFVTELNKIPGIDLDDRSYRIFKVKIDGNINGDNYVTSFKWIE